MTTAADFYADASWAVSGNTNIPTIMIAEKAADMMRGRRAPPAEV